MDKQEYRELTDEIKHAYRSGDYSQAVTLAQELDASKVKEAYLLEIISESYEKVGRYELAKETLLYARGRAPSGKNIAQRLCRLSIKLGDLDSAVEYYEDFCKVNPNSPIKYLLKYQIGFAGGIAPEELIKVLEKYTSTEMDERWKYELARLYHETGQADKCVELCDEIILWFGNDEYVKKAMELKFAHKALSPSQQERYELMTGQIKEVPEEVPDGAAPEAKEGAADKTGEVPADEMTIEAAVEAADRQMSEGAYGEAAAAPENYAAENAAVFEKNEEGAGADAEKSYEEQEKEETQALIARLSSMLGDSGEVEETKIARLENGNAGAGAKARSAAGETKIAGEEETPANIKTPDKNIANDTKDTDKKETGVEASEDSGLNIMTESFTGGEGRKNTAVRYAASVRSAMSAAAKRAAEEKEEARRAQEEYKNGYGAAYFGAAPGAEGTDEERPNTDTAARKLGASFLRMSSFSEVVLRPTLKKEHIKDTLEAEAQAAEGVNIVDSVDSSNIPMAGEDDGQIGLNLELLSSKEKNVDGQISIDQAFEIYSQRLEANQDKVTAVENERLKKIQEAVNDTARATPLYIIVDDEDKLSPDEEQAEKKTEDGDAEIKTEDIAAQEKEPEVKSGDTADEAAETAAEVKPEPEPEPETAETASETAEAAKEAADSAVSETEIPPAEETAEEEAKTEEPSQEEPAPEDEEIAALIDEAEEDDADFSAAVAELSAVTEPIEDDEEIDEDEAFFLGGLIDEAEESLNTEAEEEAAAETETEEEAAAETGTEEETAANTEAEEEAAAETEAEEETAAETETEEEAAAETGTGEEAIVEENERKPEAAAESENESESGEALPEEAKEPEPEDYSATIKIDIPPSERRARRTSYQLPNDIRDELLEFMLVDGMEDAICETIGSLLEKHEQGDPASGNLIVTGDAKSGKTYMITEIIKALAKETGSGGGKVAKVQAEALNGKNLEKVFAKIKGMELIIENVGDFEDATIERLITEIKKKNPGGLVVLEGNKIALENIISSFPEIRSLFKTRLDISELSLVEWADIASEYAQQRGFVLDDMAKLALHEKINEANIPTSRLGYDDITDLVDKAILKAQKRGSGRLFSAFSRKRDGEMKVLQEGDFD